MDKKTQVVVTSNPRGNNISQAEVEQCIKDLNDWFKTNATSVAKDLQSVKPATDKQIEDLQDNVKLTIPKDLIALLKVADGKFQLHDSYKTLSVQQIIEQNEVNAVSAFWKKNYLTVAQDIDSNYLIIQCNSDGTSGNVVTWNNDDGVSEELNHSFGLYLENIRNGLLKKELEYIDEVGLVERAN
ncbi:hypothetical protein ABPG72_002631 [Tetrahymena utriculariae]